MIYLCGRLPSELDCLSSPGHPSPLTSALPKTGKLPWSSLCVSQQRDRFLRHSDTGPGPAGDWPSPDPATSPGGTRTGKDGACSRPRAWSVRTFQDFLPPLPQLHKKWCSWNSTSPFTKLVDSVSTAALHVWPRLRRRSIRITHEVTAVLSLTFVSSVSGSVQSGCWRQRRQEGLLGRPPGGQSRPQHHLRLVHQQRFLPPDAVSAEAAAPQLHQQPAALALHRALLRPALWCGRSGEDPRRHSRREPPVGARVLLHSLHPVSGGERPSREEARVSGWGRSRQRSGVCHLWGGGPAASGPVRALGPNLSLGRAERVGRGHVRGEEPRRWEQQPRRPEPEGSAWVEAVGEPGIGRRRSALPDRVRRGGRQRAVPQTVRSAVQCDQSDVTGDDAGERSRDSWGRRAFDTLKCVFLKSVITTHPAAFCCLCSAFFYFL